MARFREQLESRRRKRARKQREERRRERRIEAEENRLMGRFPGPMVRIESAYHYPQLGGEPGRPPVMERGSPAAEDSADTASPDLGSSPATASSAAFGPSFAKVKGYIFVLAKTVTLFYLFFYIGANRIIRYLQWARKVYAAAAEK